MTRLPLRSRITAGSWAPATCESGVTLAKLLRAGAAAVQAGGRATSIPPGAQARQVASQERPLPQSPSEVQGLRHISGVDGVEAHSTPPAHGQADEQNEASPTVAQVRPAAQFPWAPVPAGLQAWPSCGAGGGGAV